MAARRRHRHLILGAGASGLALAAGLTRRGVDAEIVLVDRRVDDARDRTWAAFAGDGLWPAGAERRRFTAWAMQREGEVVRGSSRRHPYCLIDAPALFSGLLHEAGPRVELRLGTAVLGVTRTADGWVVRTSDGEIEADSVVDALGPSSPLLAERPRGLFQRFTGFEVQVEHPVFDPGTAMLMDFDWPQDPSGGVRFCYRLALTPTRALVEDTSLTAGPALPTHERWEAVAAWLDGQGAGAVEVLHRERASLPMTATWPAHRLAIPTVGAAAGALRPSSGYGLVRLLRHAEAMADAIATGRDPLSVPAPGQASLRPLDGIFLRALHDEPERFPEVFVAMARRLDDEAFVRFMSDRAGARDVARMIASVPRAPFLRAAAALRSAA
ncbi:MAG: Lycopene beta and epsilon cyclase [Solirubrobacterales bacterium]|nr:Lycopene beta and epsilon cyclase [Solirubrobacterales bacterium]